ncbi:CpaF family protein [Pelotomaculum propionicicum]|uniref:CpaF family protein n=1 Tax=Pelotomaculum propionicicum TaxID=258475 RepID=UPI003B7D29BA
MEQIVDTCRKHVLSLFQKGQDVDDVLDSELNSFLQRKYPELSFAEKNEAVKIIKDDIKGYGPVQDLMDDNTITDIVVIKPDRIVYEQNGEIKLATAGFWSESHLRLFIERLCHRGKRKVDESSPTISLKLPEGYRVAISIPPLSGGSYLAIRKFIYCGSIDGMVPVTFSKEGAEFLKAATRAMVNMVFVGSMGTGKTTMIAVLGHEFAPMDLPLLVEEVEECPLDHQNLRKYVARPPNIEGKGEIKFDYILKHALQTRGNRILVAEVRDGAIFYMLRAMATGQSGMGTLHAESPQDAVRVQIPMLMGQAPEASAMDQATRNLIISSAIDLVVQMAKECDENGKEIRVCTHISEVQHSQGDAVQVKDIFVRRNREMVPTGYVPERILKKMNKKKVHYNLKGGQ